MRQFVTIATNAFMELVRQPVFLLLMTSSAVFEIFLATPYYFAFGDEPTAQPRAFIDGTGPGWRALGESDFVNVNCAPETWTWKEGVVHCTGEPTGATPGRFVHGPGWHRCH